MPGLLNDPIEIREDAQHALAATALWDLHLAVDTLAGEAGDLRPQAIGLTPGTKGALARFGKEKPRSSAVYTFLLFGDFLVGARGFEPPTT